VFASEIIEHLAQRAVHESAVRHLQPGADSFTTPYAQGIQHVLYAWLRFPKTASNPEHIVVLPFDSPFWPPPPVSKSRRSSDHGLPSSGAKSLLPAGSQVLVAISPVIPMRVKANTMLAVLVRVTKRERSA
jgi:hypothetical protein